MYQMYFAHELRAAFARPSPKAKAVFIKDLAKWSLGRRTANNIMIRISGRFKAFCMHKYVRRHIC